MDAARVYLVIQIVVAVLTVGGSLFGIVVFLRKPRQFSWRLQAAAVAAAVVVVVLGLVSQTIPSLAPAPGPIASAAPPPTLSPAELQNVVTPTIAAIPTNGPLPSVVINSVTCDQNALKVQFVTDNIRADQQPWAFLTTDTPSPRWFPSGAPVFTTDGQWIATLSTGLPTDYRVAVGVLTPGGKGFVQKYLTDRTKDQRWDLGLPNLPSDVVVLSALSVQCSAAERAQLGEQAKVATVGPAQP